jgi:hypothetical protein
MTRSDASLISNSKSGYLRPRRHLSHSVKAAPETGGTALAATGATTLLVFMATLLVPISFKVAGLNFPLYRVLLIFILIPLSLRFLREKNYRINAVDILILGYIVWTGLSVYANEGMSRIPFAGSTAIDQYGAYLIGRMLILHAWDFRTFIKYFMWSLIVLFPLAVLEMFFRAYPVQSLIAAAGLGEPPGTGGEGRFGFPRVKTVMPHAILFGIFCGISIGNILYVYKSFWRKWSAFSLASLLTLMSLSTTPTLGLLIQLCLVAWDKLSGSVRGKWILGGMLALLFAVILQLSAEGGVFGFFIDSVAYEAQTGWGRLEIIQYATAEIVRHPIFGIGFDDWVRPFWRGTASIDTFWWATAMRFGLPTALFLIAALAVHLYWIIRQQDLDEKTRDYRKGYVIAWVGLLFGLTFVHFWGAPSLFLLTYIGAGVWFYDRRTSPEPANASLVSDVARGEGTRRLHGRRWPADRWDSARPKGLEKERVR